MLNPGARVTDRLTIQLPSSETILQTALTRWHAFVLQVWTVTSDAKITDRLVVHLPSPATILEQALPLGLALQSPATASSPYMDLALDTAWLPGSDTHITVTTPLAVLVYDLAQSAKLPIATVVVPGNELIASSAVGCQFVTHSEVSQRSTARPTLQHGRCYERNYLQVS